MKILKQNIGAHVSVFTTALLFALALAACGRPNAAANVSSSGVRLPASDTSRPRHDHTEAAEHVNSTEEMPVVVIAVEGRKFYAILQDNPAAHGFAGLLPLTVEMQDLNGNEKYHYLAGRLPTESEPVEMIRAGDLMLYGSDCLVLFYEDFATPYSYTRLGQVEDAAGLADALGLGSVTITFRIEE
ncbi:hypothetical protein LJC04_03275 [Ruminococcaceae bacterium OttesenSCG-928-O06]|nr:hypothetical protein [Ruminococcaceae bacterium OttesenSCG-928-O06]